MESGKSRAQPTRKCKEGISHVPQKKRARSCEYETKEVLRENIDSLEKDVRWALNMLDNRTKEFSSFLEDHNLVEEFRLWKHNREKLIYAQIITQSSPQYWPAYMSE